MLFRSEENVPTRAVTMGVGTILEAKRVVMIAFGEGKAPVVARAIEGAVTNSIAASFLQEHANAQVYLDLAAAELETLITTPNQPDRAVVGWLNDLADVHLRNPDGLPAANATLQRIVDRFPGSAWAEAARSRLARLGFAARAREIPKTIKLGNYEQNIGLKPDFKPPRQ